MTIFKQFNRTMLKPLNILWAKVASIDNMRGDDFISVKRTGFGTTIGMNLAAVRRRVAKGGGAGIDSTTPGIIRKAQVSEPAGLGTTIKADLYDYTTGVLATSGDEYDVDINCRISGGSDLNEAVPRLEDGDTIFVSLNSRWTGTATDSTWDCVTVFSGSEDCTCEQADAVFNSVTIASDEKLTLDGVGGDTFIRHNSVDSEVEHTVDGDKVTTW